MDATLHCPPSYAPPAGKLTRREVGSVKKVEVAWYTKQTVGNILKILKIPVGGCVREETRLTTLADDDDPLRSDRRQVNARGFLEAGYGFLFVGVDVKGGFQASDLQEPLNPLIQAG